MSKKGLSIAYKIDKMKNQSFEIKDIYQIQIYFKSKATIFSFHKLNWFKNSIPQMPVKN